MRYFFCGIGGSGMMPLSLILAAQGHSVAGSDRGHDRGQTPDKFEYLLKKGITLSPQDGTGPGTYNADVLVVSAAIEDSVPDVAAAKAAGLSIRTRAQVLAELFNGYDAGISVAGTSGKSTVTGMLATILAECEQDPTVMNGGVIENFSASMRVGAGDVFVTETDESDGSIALYKPAIAIVNNIALDHMDFKTLEALFAGLMAKAGKAVIVNACDARVMDVLAGAEVKAPVISYGIDVPADVRVDSADITYRSDGVSFVCEGHTVNLYVVGRHNVMNALAALTAAQVAGVALENAILALAAFRGVRRRLQCVGSAGGVSVYDDFAHNPDKIAASLDALRAFEGRLLVMFQPHGFGPLRLMGKEIVQSFVAGFGAGDVLFMPEVYYAGGTVDRSVTSKDIIADAVECGIKAHWFEDREAAFEAMRTHVQPGDRVVFMGARDDTLTLAAREFLATSRRTQGEGM